MLLKNAYLGDCQVVALPSCTLRKLLRFKNCDSCVLYGRVRSSIFNRVLTVFNAVLAVLCLIACIKIFCLLKCQLCYV